jgi:uncharacterized protein YbjT (DUF2867 family)
VVRATDLDGAYPHIDEEDLAAIAAVTLTREGYVGQALTVHGEPIGLRDRLRVIGEALGRRLPFEELTPEQAAAQAKAAGVPDEEVDAWLAAEEAWVEQEDAEAYDR